MGLDGLAKGIVFGVLGIVVVMVLIAGLYPTLVEAGNDLNESGMPQGDKFATGGVAWTIFGIIIFVVVILAVIGFIKFKN